jgi:hypothetical protein
MFLLNFQVEVIIFIKREPTPYKEHEVNTSYLGQYNLQPKAYVQKITDPKLSKL